jgi:hypothetical protein
VGALLPILSPDIKSAVSLSVFCHSIYWMVVTEPREGISYYVILSFDMNDMNVLKVKLLQRKLPTSHFG